MGLTMLTSFWNIGFESDKLKRELVFFETPLILPFFLNRNRKMEVKTFYFVAASRLKNLGPVVQNKLCC